METRLIQLFRDAMSPEPQNSIEFAIAQAKKHNDKVDELAEKVYQAYLSNGEEVAIERRDIYKKNNHKHYSEFV